MVSHEERIQVVHNSPYRGMNIDYKVIGENNQSIFPGTWFIYDVDPIPEYEELIKIISDIEIGKPRHYCGDNGLLRHNEECTGKHELSELLTRAAVSLKPMIYRAAMWLGDEIYKIPENFNGHPVVVVLSEDISGYSYPFYSGLNKMFEFEKYYMPESICHTAIEKKVEADRNIVKNIENTIHCTSEWLMMFRLWKTCGIWLGREKTTNHPDDEYMELTAQNRKRHRKVLKEMKKKLNRENNKKNLFSEII